MLLVHKFFFIQVKTVFYTSCGIGIQTNKNRYKNRGYRKTIFYISSEIKI